MTISPDNEMTLSLISVDAPQTEDYQLKKTQWVEPKVHVNVGQSSTNHNINVSSSLAQALTRSDGGSDPIWKAVAKELLMNLIIPERLVKTAQALLCLMLALLALDAQQKGLLQLLVGNH